MICHYENFKANSNLLYPRKNIQWIQPNVLDGDNYNEEKYDSLNSKERFFSPNTTNENSIDN